MIFANQLAINRQQEGNALHYNLGDSYAIITLSTTKDKDADLCSILSATDFCPILHVYDAMRFLYCFSFSAGPPVPVIIALPNETLQTTALTAFGLCRDDVESVVNRIMQTVGFDASEPPEDFINGADSNIRVFLHMDLPIVRRIQGQLNVPFENAFGAYHYALHLERFGVLSKEEIMRRAEARYIDVIGD